MVNWWTLFFFLGRLSKKNDLDFNYLEIIIQANLNHRSLLWQNPIKHPNHRPCCPLSWFCFYCGFIRKWSIYMSHHLFSEASKAHQHSWTGLKALSWNNNHCLYFAWFPGFLWTCRHLLDSFRLFAACCTHFQLLQDSWLPERPCCPKPPGVPPPGRRWWQPGNSVRSVPHRHSRMRPRTGWTCWRLGWTQKELLPVPLAGSSEEDGCPSTR